MENIPCGASGSEIIRAFRPAKRSVLTQRIFAIIYLYFNTRNYCYFKKSTTGYFNVLRRHSYSYSSRFPVTDEDFAPVLSSAGVGWERPLLEHSGDRILSSAAGAAAGTVAPPPPGKRWAGWHLTGENMAHVAVLHPAPRLKASRREFKVWAWGKRSSSGSSSSLQALLFNSSEKKWCGFICCRPQHYT